MKKLLTKLWGLFSLLPLTGRGFAALLFSALLIFYFAKEQSDLVAAILGTTLLLTIALCLTTLMLTTPLIRRRLIISSNDGAAQYISHQKNSSGFVLEGLSIPAFFSLSIKRKFDTPAVVHQAHILTGRFSASNFISTSKTSDNKHYFLDTVQFPHRGEYVSEGFEIYFSDIFGLTKRKWRTDTRIAYRAAPPALEIAPLNIMAASSQIGDTQSSQDNKSGDLFDLRAYHPGDSLKRVLWKVYARSGELVVREPEPAIIPEGEVAIFIAAMPEQDEVVSAALSYIKLLESQNILLSVSFPGLENKIASTFTEAEEFSIDSASIRQSEQSKLQVYIETLKSKSSRPERIVVFISEGVETRSQIARLAEDADKAGIRLIFALVPTFEFPNEEKLASKNRIFDKIQGIKKKSLRSQDNDIQSTIIFGTNSHDTERISIESR